MDRLNLRLPRSEVLEPYCCTELIEKSESCTTAEFSPCSEYLIVGTSSGHLLVYSFLTHSIIFRYVPDNAWGKVLKVKWKENSFYALTDSNCLYTLSESWEIESEIPFNFKSLGFDVFLDRAIVYGKSDIVLCASKSQRSLKLNEGSSEWFGSFTPENIVIFGTPTNVFYVLDLEGELLFTQEVSHVFQTSVRDFLHYSKMFLINSRDKLLHLFELQEPFCFVDIKEIGDYVERKRWSSCCFFHCPNRENPFILATPQESGSHSLKMYDTVYSDQRVNLAKNMNSPLGAAIHLTSSSDLHLHPIIVVVTRTGGVLLWASGSFHMRQKWSTSLGIPNFVELQDGNLYFEEPEDQYDKESKQRLPLELNPDVKPRPFRLDYS